MSWTKRKVFDLPLPSGTTRKVRRPGPELAVSAGRLQRTLKVNVTDKSQEQVAEEFMDSLTDTSEDAMIKFSEKAFLACLVNDPSEEFHVVANPRRPNEISCADVPLNDFWTVVGWFNNGCPDIPVETAEGETTVEAVETFPSEQGGSIEPGSNGQTVLDESRALVGAAG